MRAVSIGWVLLPKKNVFLRVIKITVGFRLRESTQILLVFLVMPYQYKFFLQQPLTASMRT